MSRNPTPSKHEGFFIVPLIPELAVSKDGSVILESTGACVVDALDDNLYDYRRININNKSYSVHRLIAETFLEKESEDLIVNHKNGVKRDNRLENLEWVDYSGNILHAYKTGLRVDNHPVLAKDLRTGEILRFYSLNEAGRHFKSSGANIFHQLRPENFGKIYRDYFVLIREGQEWPNVGPEAIGKHRNGTAKSVYLYNEEEKKLLIFKSGMEAAAHLKVSDCTVFNWLRKANSSESKSYQKGQWIIGLWKNHGGRFEGKIEPYFVPGKTWKRTPRKPKRIRVTDLETNEVKEMNSLGEFAARHGTSKSAIQRHIWVNNGRWFNRFHIEYVKV